MATVPSVVPKTRGGAFLLETRAPSDVFTPEDFTAEHRAIARTTEEFWTKEIAPHLDKIRHQRHDVALAVLKKSAQLGLTAVVIPEKHGGMELDLTSAMIVAEGVSGDGSYAAWHGAHTGIGTLPLLLFGTEEQKRKYLSQLASADMIAAYCLSEPQAGSDALAARTRADLSQDGKHYVLSGQKMWITNGGFADLFTVFAATGPEQGAGKLTAFLVERAWPGVSVGAEEKKMGIKGSSTTAVYFDNVKVPAGNVLGEVGRGHVIAFNILNIGRLKLGAFANGGSRDALAGSIRYAKDRKAFGKSIAEFGLIQHKLAEMAIRLYVSESMVYRVTGAIEANLQPFSWDAPEAGRRVLEAIEEFAIESSFVKIFASETLDYVVDEGVQIHGGYGFHQDYSIEHAYRDSRVNRIFEGTNEINRLLATGMLLKRAKRGSLPLLEAIQRLDSEMAGAQPPVDVIASAKKAALFTLGVAFRKYRETIEEQQEIVANITDIVMNAFAMESGLLRARKIQQSGRDAANALEMAQVFSSQVMDSIGVAARTVLGACLEGEALRSGLSALGPLLEHEPVDAIALRRKIAARLIGAGRYVVS